MPAPRALPCQVLVAREGIPTSRHCGGASRLRASQGASPDKSSGESLGLGVERQAQRLGLWCRLGETPPEQWLLPCHSVWGLGRAGRGSLSKTLEGASVGGKICQAPPAPSSPSAWCSPLGSVADTEGFFIMLLSFPCSDTCRKDGDGAGWLPFHTRKDGFG